MLIKMFFFLEKSENLCNASVFGDPKASKIVHKICLRKSNDTQVNSIY